MRIYTVERPYTLTFRATGTQYPLTSEETPEYFARLALETWRASGARTEARRDDLLTRYLETYFGPQATWPETVRGLETSARGLLRARTRIDELVYA